MTKLPEPAILLPEGKWRFDVVGPVNGTLNHCPVYTEAQMLQFRRDALEEAAKLVVSLATTDCVDSNITRHECADAIRKLKDEK
jgi:hypothetical protein